MVINHTKKDLLHHLSDSRESVYKLTNKMRKQWVKLRVREYLLLDRN